MEDLELEYNAYLYKDVHRNWAETHNNANFRSIAISLKRIADSLEEGSIPSILNTMSDTLTALSFDLTPEESK